MTEKMKIYLQSYYDFWFGMNMIYEKWAKSHGITSSTLFVLYTIANHPGSCTQRLICEQLLLPKQTVHTILTLLENRKLIEKLADPQDKRSKQLILTETGTAYANALLSQLYAFEKSALLQMTEVERISMVETTQRFLEHLRASYDQTQKED